MMREIAKTDNATLKEVMCTSCGFLTECFFYERWVCACIATRVESLMAKSKTLHTWNDVMTKLTRLYCLNEVERQSGFEPNDVIVEEGDGYCIVQDQRGLLLIVVHDDESINELKMKIPQPKPKKLKIVAIGISSS